MTIQINGTSGISGVDGSAATPALQGSDTNTGISFGTDEVNINTGGTARATVDSSGNVGIGTASPGANLHSNSSGAGSTPLRLGHTGATGWNFVSGVAGNTDEALTIQRGTSDWLQFWAGVGAILSIDGSEAFRVDTSGRLIVGTSSAGNLSAKGFRVATSSDSSSDYAAEFYSNSSTLLMLRNDGYFRSPIIYNRTSGGSANVFVDSAGYIYRSTSSQRYKRDIQPASYTLDQIDTLKPVTYKSGVNGPDGNLSDRVFGGLIAEDVDAVGLQEFVDYDDQGRPDALQYGHMIAVAIKGLQEAHARIKELEAKVTALEGGTN